MPARAVLNVVYAMLTDGMDSKQRQEFDTSLYGWDALNDQANRRLRGPADEDESGGES